MSSRSAADRGAARRPPWGWLLAALAVGGLSGARLLALFDAVPTETPSVKSTAEGAGAAALPRSSAPSTAVIGEEPPRLRQRKKPPRALPELTSMYDWPHEPKAPATLDDARFSEALAMLCGPATDHEVRTRHAPALLRAAREFGADAFLLGALIYRESGCSRALHRETGLTNLATELYADDVKNGTYHYRGFEDGRWVARSLDVSRYPFTQVSIQNPDANLYFAAAFLRAWREQQRGLFVAFSQREHRHHVSHFVWGDKVGSARQENWILVDRRRLLEYYGAKKAEGPVNFRGFSLGCPLDGCPRLVTSTLGDARDQGKRTHRGTDFESTHGEPVRAVADGTVLFAGVDWPGRGKNQRVPIYAQRSLERSAMGAGGLYVCIRHDRPKLASLVSCYMHLDTALVSQGRRVQRGEQIGKVGRTGIKVSAPHLHFELHADDGIQAAERVLGPLALGKPKVHGAPEAKAAQASSSAAAKPPARRARKHAQGSRARRHTDNKRLSAGDF